MNLISNKLLYKIHGWLGLNLGLLLFIICFSGTFAVFSSEVDWLINPDMRVAPQDKPIQWEQMYKSVQDAFPDGNNLGIYKETYASSGKRFTSVAYVSIPNGQIRKVYLNPYTGQIQGDTSFFNTQRFFRSFHRRFFDGNRGIFIVTLSSFFLLFSSVTGFLFYKGWLKNLFKLRLKNGLKALWSDTHKLLGIWSLIFALLIALTGVFYFAELLIQGTDNGEVLLPDSPTPITETEQATFGPTPELLPVSTYIHNAKKAFPGLDIQSLRVPTAPGEYVYIDGQAGNPFTRDRANKVYLHPFTGEVVHVQQSSDLNTAEFITDIADPIHFGYFGGIPTKILWFIFGLALSFAILSGTYLWYIRNSAKTDRRIQRLNNKTNGTDSSTYKEKPFARTLGNIPLMRGAIISTAITLLYLLHVTFVTVDDVRYYAPNRLPATASIDTIETGPWEFKLQTSSDRNGRSIITAEVLTNGLPNFKKAYLTSGTEGKVDSASIPLARNSSLSARHFATDSLANLPETFTLVTQSFDGTIYEATVSRKNLANVTYEHPAVANATPTFPNTPASIWIYIGAFILLTISIIGLWLRFLLTNLRDKFRVNTIQAIRRENIHGDPVRSMNPG
ncbi:PepSY domain-containing protein [Aliifodinibius sp. S!AR15-10]|nr:PepSY domain-containing protein [Aliifodinibius sp. S!AR15-10]